MKPTRSFAHLPWRDEMPDEEGYWWFRHRMNDLNEKHAFSEYVAAEEISGEVDLFLEPLDISRMTPERWAEEGWQCTPVVLPLDLRNVTYEMPHVASEEVPNECPECGAPIQSTYPTPPDEGFAYGCTSCTWPTEKDSE